MISSAAATECVSTVHIYLVEKRYKNIYSSARLWASYKYTASCGRFVCVLCESRGTVHEKN
jgi:hypothetical protein